MRDAFIEELTLLAREDPSIFLVIGDIGFSVIEDFAQEFPDRFLNAGVAEQTMIGLASGLASSGFKVFVYSIGNFPTLRCLEQIRNDVCYHDRSVTMVAVGGGFSYGSLGYTHHAIEDIAVMRAMPGMVVMSPSDPYEARCLTRQAATSGGPHYLRLGKNGESVLHEERELSVLGAAPIIREGTDVTILATGSILELAIRAHERLLKDGISTRVASVPVLKPLSASVLDVAQGTRGIVTIEEHSIVGGLGSSILERAAMVRSRLRIYPIGIPESGEDRTVGSQQYLREINGLTEDSITAAVKELIEAS